MLPFRPPIALFSPEWVTIHLAAPPLHSNNPLLLEPSRLLTRTVHPRTPTDEQRLIGYHSYFHSQIAAMCNEISVRLEGEATVHGMGPDKDLFRQVVETLEQGFSRTNDRAAALLRARGLQSKLRWDIERFPNAPTRWRTVDAFVLEVLGTFHAGVLGRHIEPTYLVSRLVRSRVARCADSSFVNAVDLRRASSLHPRAYSFPSNSHTHRELTELSQIDISAWVVYCTNPSSESWKTIWRQFEQTDGPAGRAWEGIIHAHRGSWDRLLAQAQREIGKERFVPRARTVGRF
ncbi:hypothetical protein AAT19DRAFT_8392 [Rhodotorula toruloides]|uniref:Uncharacterized protein n=1 Tax=Rhodotorula toruloides TaxID=5286 RepID=A0A2T0AH54_RHOTO|nr:hypothetical protein AAT19DRAFT_8392 [Rhodotorula toruloides]